MFNSLKILSVLPYGHTNIPCGTGDVGSSRSVTASEKTPTTLTTSVSGTAVFESS